MVATTSSSNWGMMRQLTACILLASMLLPDVASALTPVTVNLPLTIRFEKLSAEVSLEQKDKLLSAFKRISAEDWCPFVQGFVIGYASKDEGMETEREALARRRGDHVKRLLDEIGFPKERTYLLSSNSPLALKSEPNSEVELRFDGFPGNANCSVPLSPSGLRTNP